MARIAPILIPLLLASLVGLSRTSQGSVKLTGSERGMEGKLKVRNGDDWLTVCYDGWTSADADTACRQLGFPKGAMIFRADDGSFDDGSPSRLGLRAPGCGPSDNRLPDCANFEFQDNLACSEEVIMSCYVNDFQGCYQDFPSSLMSQAVVYITDQSQYTISACVALCRQINFKFATLTAPECMCETDDSNLNNAVSTAHCNTACQGDAMEACGSQSNDVKFSAVWPTSMGRPGGSLTAAEGCFYSRDFPSAYTTGGVDTTDQYSVTLLESAYVLLRVKSLDLFADDMLTFEHSPSGTSIPLTESHGDYLVPIKDRRIASFNLEFTTVADSPSSVNYGFIVCFESFDELPETTTTPRITTPPPTVKPTTPAPTQPPPDPTSSSPSPASSPPTTPSAPLTPMTPAPTNPPDPPTPSVPVVMSTMTATPEEESTTVAEETATSQEVSETATEAKSDSTTEDPGIIINFSFTEMIIVVVVLVLFCMAIFLFACGLVCCRSWMSGNQAKAPAPKPAEPPLGADQPDGSEGDVITDSFPDDDNQFLINIEDEMAADPVVNPEMDDGVAALKMDGDQAAAPMDDSLAAAPTDEGTAVMDNPVLDESPTPDENEL